MKYYIKNTKTGEYKKKGAYVFTDDINSAYLYSKRTAQDLIKGRRNLKMVVEVEPSSTPAEPVEENVPETPDCYLVMLGKKKQTFFAAPGEGLVHSLDQAHLFVRSEADLRASASKDIKILTLNEIEKIGGMDKTKKFIKEVTREYNTQNGIRNAGEIDWDKFWLGFHKFALVFWVLLMVFVFIAPFAK